MTAEPQAAVLAFLSDPATWGGERPTRIDTHGAYVFLAGERAYKLKRAVKFPYMNFSTQQLRDRAAAEELARNRRTAPDLYLGLLRVSRAGEGFALDGPGETVETLLVMRRFDQDQLFDRIAARGALTPDLAETAAVAIAAFHAKAQPVAGRGGGGWARDLVAGLERDLDRAGLFAPADRMAVVGGLEAMAEGQAGLLDARAAQGLVRRCHGDLHLRNICLIAGNPVLFDAIEFNDDFSDIDVLYDLAFLMMDLARLDLHVAANRVLNRYLEETADHAGLPALPFFMAARAAVRAHALAADATAQADSTMRERLEGEARGALALARACLVAPPRIVVAIGGFQGTGKTTVARALAPMLGPPPGAVIVRSDVLRKQIAGVERTRRLPRGAYTKAASDRVYERMMTLGALVARGGPVILDAVFAMPEERRRAARIAGDAAADFVGAWLEVPVAVAMRRLEGRRGDASDADATVLARQMEIGTGPIAWRRHDASGIAQATARAILGDLI